MADRIIPKNFEGSPLMIRDKIVITASAEGDRASDASIFSGISHQHKLTIRAEGMDPFTFPVDPFISLSFKNIITRRTVAKGSKRGTVKERWTEDDVDITISGTMQGQDGNYPIEVDKLRAIFQQHKSVEVVECPLLKDRGIDYISLDSLELPHTKGAENQQFEIKAYSDDIMELLIEQ